jgi:Asp-tRNA(Asn)/Glu-tRNA(Gln) amidotransferase A subunit family amidase
MVFPKTFRSASARRGLTRRALFAVAAATTAATAMPVVAQTAVDVQELTVADIQAGFTAGTFTSQTLTSSFFDRIEQFEPTYNAFISFNPDAAAQAAASDARRANGTALGPLDGVPVVVKDNMDYAGQPTTNGYAGFDSRRNGIDIIPGTDSSVVARLKAAGAVIIGKTNLPDFANDGLRSNSSNEGITRNPSQFNKVPGGSSGGTATAVNASFAVLGLGTETGRSIHNPAGFQSLVGIRPSQGLVPIDGIAPLNGTYRDVAGPITKTVYDAAVTLDVLAGPSGRDRLSANSEIPLGGYTSKLSTSALVGARVGYFDNGFLPVFQTVNGVPHRHLSATPMRPPPPSTKPPST